MYLTKQWGNAVRSSQEDPAPTPEAEVQTCYKSNMVSGTVSMGERNDRLHKENNRTILHTEYNAKIIQVYVLQGETSTRDHHLFATAKHS